MNATPLPTPKCVDYLPAVMREAILARPSNPIRAFLDVFEQELLRVQRIADHSHLLFDPDAFDSVPEISSSGATASVPEADRSGERPLTPRPSPLAWEARFARWLASCVAMDEAMNVAEENARTVKPGARALIRNAAWLYRLRGTPRGLAASVQAHSDLDVKVVERSFPAGMRIGTTSTIGLNSWMMPPWDPARQFTVIIYANQANAPLLTAARTESRSVAKLRSPEPAEIWIWGPSQRRSVLAFSVGQLKDPPALIRRLASQSDAVSSFLWKQFSGTGQQILRDPNADPETKKIQLVEELNRVVRGPCIYDHRRFPGEKLSTTTAALLSKALDPETAHALNRLLLEDSYPDQLTSWSDESGGPDAGSHKPEASDATRDPAALIHRLRSLLEREKPASTCFYLAAEAAAPPPSSETEPWLRIGTGGSRSTASFVAGDLRDPAGLARKWRLRADPVSQFLWDGLNSRTQQALREEGATLEETSELLVQELNRVIQGPSIQQAGRFDLPKLSREALSIASQNPDGEERARLNRLFLEAAYPRELAKAAVCPTSVVGRFCIK